MAQVNRNTTTDDFVYIDLDDPAPWWSSLVGAVVVVLIASVLIAPWVVDLGDKETDAVVNSALQSTNSICRPDTSGISSVLDPSVASWNRFCEWFIDPDNGGAP